MRQSDLHTDARELNAKFLKRWVELTRDNGGEVTMYEYYTARSSWKGVGFYLMHLIANELSFFEKIGLAGCSVQAIYGERGGTWQGKAANLYVFAKCAWDTDLDTDALLEEYCTHRYGKASDAMYRYLQEAENQSRNYLKYFVRGAAKEKQAASLALCEKYLEEAKGLANTEQAKKNVLAEEANFIKLRKFQVGE